MSPAPDSPQPIEGWRVWFADDRDGEWRLVSLNGTRWEPRSELVARCGLPTDGAHDHESPSSDCTCGIYAARDRARALYWHGPPRLMQVVGKVNLWGRVIVHERGYRAEYAYPRS